MNNYLATPFSRFTQYEVLNFKADIGLVDEIRNLISLNYNDVSSLLERELSHNNIIYLTRDEHGELASFLMTNFDIIDNEVFSYMGLMAVRHQYKCQSLTAPMILQYIQGLKRKERELGQTILAWSTTASISSYKCIASFCEEYQPKEDGSFTSAGIELANKIIRHFKLNHDENNPFALRQVAQDTRYSALEKERIEKIAQRRKFSLFESFGIEEKRGDRLLLIGFKLSLEKYSKWLTRLGVDTSVNI